MPRTIFIRTALVIAAALTTGVVLGQDLLPEVAPPNFAPFDPPPAATQPFEATPLDPPPSDESRPAFNPLNAAPSENAPPAPPKGVPPEGQAEGFMSGRGMGGPGMGGPGYGAAWYPSRPHSGSSVGDFGLVRQRVSGAVPVWRDGSDLVLLSAGVGNSMFFTDALLPESRRPFPNELWNVSLGTNYLHKFDNGWSGGLGINFGSASDQPFHSVNEMNVGFLSFLHVPVRDERDAWRFMLMYSPVGNLNFPLPGAAYLWNPSDAFHASIGLPFSVMWRPVEDLTINASYIPLITVNARATYRLAGQVFLFGGFESVQEAYLLADREDRLDRFLGYEKRLVGGVRWDAWRHAALEAGSGYAFDRFYGVGRNQIGDLHDQVDIAPGPFVSANFHLRY